MSEISTASASSSKASASTIVFGSTPSKIFDEVRCAVDVAIVEAVSALPFLPSSQSSSSHFQRSKATKDEESSTQGKQIDNEGVNKHSVSEDVDGAAKLQKRLQAAYDINCDKCEAYAMRNVFSIPRRWRMELVSSFKSSESVASPNCYASLATSEIDGTAPFVDKRRLGMHHKNNPESVSTSAINSGSDGRLAPPDWMSSIHGKEDIPTETDMAKLDKELTMLRNKLRQRKLERSNLSLRLRELSSARQCAETSVAELKAALTDPSRLDVENSVGADAARIHEAVIAALAGKRSLEDCCTDGTEVAAKLDEIAVSAVDGTFSETYAASSTTKVNRNRDGRDKMLEFAKRQIRPDGASALLAHLKRLDHGKA